MPTIYEHQKPDNRILNWAYARQQEIKKEVEQLALENGLMQMIIDKFSKLVCERCGGSGHKMLYVEGCECDGRRMHTCRVCKGTGKPMEATA